MPVVVDEPAVEPGEHVVRWVSVGVLLDQTEERLLDQVIRRVRIAREGIREAREAALVLVVCRHDVVRSKIRTGCECDPSDRWPPTGGGDLVLHLS